jgi:hypothetical protein
MATIDVREEGEEVTSITFGKDGGYLTNKSLVAIDIHGGDEFSEFRISVHKSDIDYLIKALQKAKELWT